jgi:type I restriction enzyme S subunit
MSSEDYEFLGFSAVVRNVPPTTYLNSFCKGFRPNTNLVFPEYLNYFCRSSFGRALISRMGFGFTRINLRTGSLLSVPVLSPPAAEQRAIAAFLDRETTKIDALIAEQERLIELLQEKRQAVISHAVTKGLDPSAPMKPSGVEWLGEVPAHWEVRRIASISTKITNGYVGPTRDILTSGGVRYLQSLHIKNNSIVFDVPYFVSQEWSERHAKSILEAGDVLIVQTGDIGQVAVVNAEFKHCNCHALIIVTPTKSEIAGDWLGWVLNSKYGFHTLLSIQTGALHPHLNCSDVRDVWVPVPPLTEQLELVSLIVGSIVRSDVLADGARKAIALLTERRSALISAAVTGQIDVRNSVAVEAA